MIRLTGFAPWEFEFRFPGSLTSTFLVFAADNLEEGLSLAAQVRLVPTIP